ncbi:MAG: ABC transporter substrate-binding protein [Acidobacteria bacterium]|nr:ABC transporter substrate-binding protein [Acidobacteriota bacterium]
MQKLLLGHSPDPDDAFMFYPLLSGKIPCEGFEFEQVLEGIETLNRRALKREIEVTAASVHACALLGKSYKILDCGASVGDGYGPIVVSRTPMTVKELVNVEVLVPGILTTAFLALRLAAGRFRPKVAPFDQIPGEVLAGKAEAGLLIHEGQLTYAAMGLHKVADLGVWWQEKTGLPLPLGVNVARADLGDATIKKIHEALKKSIEWALGHRAEALAHAGGFGRGIDADTTDRFVSMYVNEWTISLGKRGRLAIERLIGDGRDAGVIPDGDGPVFA